MMTKIVKFTLRTESELLQKFHFVAQYHGRSSNRELEILMKKHIAEFEENIRKLFWNNSHARYQKPTRA